MFGTFTDVSSATSRLGSLHSQCSCGAKMLRIIISMASAICTDRRNYTRCPWWWMFTSMRYLERLKAHPGETSEDGKLPLESPKTYGFYSIFHHKCVWNNEPYENIIKRQFSYGSHITKVDKFECIFSWLSPFWLKNELWLGSFPSDLFGILYKD